MLRWLAVVVTVLAAFLYYRPLATYVETRDALDAREAEVAGLRAEKRRLERRVEIAEGPDALLVQARHLGLVLEGERLFIVRGVDECRRDRCWARRRP